MEGLLEVGRGRVGPEAIDYNGHMNVVHYRAAFDAGTDGLFAHLGLGPDDYRFFYLFNDHWIVSHPASLSVCDVRPAGRRS